MATIRRGGTPRDRMYALLETAAEIWAVDHEKAAATSENEFLVIAEEAYFAAYRRG